MSHRLPLTLLGAFLGGALMFGACGDADVEPSAEVSASATPSTTPMLAATTASTTAVTTDTVDDAGADVDEGVVLPAPLRANPFAQPVGNWVGGDIPRVFPLPDGREVWWLSDSFLPPTGRPPVDQFMFVRNVVFLRDLDGELTIRTGTRGGEPWDFLAHPDEDHFRRFFWPLGGMVVGDRLMVFVAEMQCERPQWGICFRPVRTWLATYTWADMQLVDLQPAPNDGVRPVYGFSVVSDDEWTYLYGTGAEYDTPHVPGGSDQTTVARVPRGRLDTTPTYWDGTGWNADPSTAAVLVQRGYSDFRLSVVPANGGYLGVAKEDEFVGRRIIVMSAPAPQGPWTDLADIPMPLSTEQPDRVTYDAAPYPFPVDGKLAIVYSTNSTIESVVFEDPSVYRPAMLFTDLPFE